MRRRLVVDVDVNIVDSVGSVGLSSDELRDGMKKMKTARKSINKRNGVGT